MSAEASLVSTAGLFFRLDGRLGIRECLVLLLIVMTLNVVNNMLGQFFFIVFGDHVDLDTAAIAIIGTLPTGCAH